MECLLLPIYSPLNQTLFPFHQKCDNISLPELSGNMPLGHSSIMPNIVGSSISPYSIVECVPIENILLIVFGRVDPSQILAYYSYFESHSKRSDNFDCEPSPYFDWDSSQQLWGVMALLKTSYLSSFDAVRIKTKTLAVNR